LPTYGWAPRFRADWDRLTPAQQAAFLAAVTQFVADMRRRRGFRKGLRVKAVQGAAGIFEMTWADDGRATSTFGEAVIEGEPHVVWRRVGTHEIFGRP
jgi:hypothetical protein